MRIVQTASDREEERDRERECVYVCVCERAKIDLGQQLKSRNRAV